MSILIELTAGLVQRLTPWKVDRGVQLQITALGRAGESRTMMMSHDS